MSEHKTLRRLVYAAVVIFVLLIGAAALVLHSRTFRSYALGKIIQTTQESTDRKSVV